MYIIILNKANIYFFFNVDKLSSLIFIMKLKEVRRSYRFAKKLEDGLTPELGIRNYELWMQANLNL